MDKCAAIGNAKSNAYYEYDLRDSDRVHLGQATVRGGRRVHSRPSCTSCATRSQREALRCFPSRLLGVLKTFWDALSDERTRWSFEACLRTFEEG